MPISVQCRTCGARLKVKEVLAGKHARCPHCKMGISIPATSAVPAPGALNELEAQDEMDFGLEDDSPVKIRKRRVAKPNQRDEDELEFVDDQVEEAAQLPPKRKKKSTFKARTFVESETLRYRGDLLVWVLLVAMLPLGIMVFLPEVTVEERVQKMVAKKADMQAELEEYGAQDFLAMNKDLTLEGAHLDRHSMVHWFYAAIATIVFLVLLHFMRHKTTVTPWGLLLAGAFTGTFGIVMLLAFQIIAEISLHLPVYGGGIGTLIIMFVKFIGFSYRSALDPDSGFIWSFVGFTCGVGFCEEICKAAPVFYYLRSTRSSDWRGTCLLGFASGAGFGISEGIMYSSSFYNGIEPGMAYVVRFASCVALHAILSGGVALLMFGNQDYLEGEDWLTFLWGGLQYILIAMVVHGLYDTLLKQHLNAVAFLIALGAFGWLAWLSRQFWDYEPSPQPELGLTY